MAPPSTLYDADIAALGTLHSLVEVFRAFDSDGDGLVSVEELSGIIASLDHIPGDRAALEMTRQGDTDGDGMLSLEELLAVVAEGLHLVRLPYLLRTAFPALAGEKTVTAEELYEILRRMGRISLEDCLDIVASMDGDRDGAVSIEDLKLVVQALSDS
ncbi:hypothetical protein HPP92_012129 [Vanilla planifolia]|uniref:EF-hand domain-containing protein n=1 Tax=Vanilla planifolia TaxID=51239 RepID=A0A835V534_VANPL|nr:hypothetical protein HPP92_012129 [Vanilla planifolia]